MLKVIRISPMVQRGSIGTKKFYSFTILVKETNRYFNWYKKAVGLGHYKLHEQFEIGVD